MSVYLETKRLIELRNATVHIILRVVKITLINEIDLIALKNVNLYLNIYNRIFIIEYL